MANFNRETRYTVLGNKDISKYLTNQELGVLDSLCKKIEVKRFQDGKNDLKCVVVEDSWPMYEEVWSMIENWDEVLNN
ncbi:MAG: hypothetical protein WC055_00740 [Melioribacteraceae bacterium]